MKLSKNPAILYLFSFLIGALLVAAFSPINMSFLAWCLPVALMAMWFHVPARQAMFCALSFSVGFFGVGISWVFISIHRYGGTDSIIAMLITASFVLLLSTPHMAQAYYLQRYFNKNTIYKILGLFPATWVIAEWLRDWLFTGFPWLYLASSQTDGLFKGFLPVLGSFGTSGLMVFSAGLLYLFFARSGKRRIVYLAIFLLTISISLSVRGVDWTRPVGKPLNISLLQGNIPQSLKWDPNNVNLSLERYWELTKQQPKHQMIIWPENSVPLPAPYASEYLAKIDHYARTKQQSIALGIPIPAGDDYFNSMLVLGTSHGIYHKQHLVPFGEYVPFENLLRGLIDFFDLPMSEFIPGESHQALIDLQHVPVAPFICYEIAYSSLVRNDMPQAQLLLVISDDAWFGDSLAPWQHLQIEQVQAISTGRDLISTTNNGVTAILSYRGAIIEQAPRDVPYALMGQVQPRDGATPWVILGNWPWIMLAFLILAFGIFKRK